MSILFAKLPGCDINIKIKKARELSSSLAVPALVNRYESLNNRITLAYMQWLRANTYQDQEDSRFFPFI